MNLALLGQNGTMLVAFSVAPAGGSSSDSVHDAVAAAVRVVRDSGLPNRTDSMFTTIEGDWDECLAVVRASVDAVQAYGSRVSLVLKADIRPGHTGELSGKLDRLEAAIARQVAPGSDGPEQPAEAAEEAEEAVGAEGEELEAEPEPAGQEPEPSPAIPPTVLARFVASDQAMVVQGAGEDDLPIACAVGARVLVAESAPPEALGLVEISRATLRSHEGSLRVDSAGTEAWRGEVGETASIVVWADAVEEPAGIWIQLDR